MRVAVNVIDGGLDEFRPGVVYLSVVFLIPIIIPLGFPAGIPQDVEPSICHLD